MQLYIFRSDGGVVYFQKWWVRGEGNNIIDISESSREWHRWSSRQWTGGIACKGTYEKAFDDGQWGILTCTVWQLYHCLSQGSRGLGKKYDYELNTTSKWNKNWSWWKILMLQPTKLFTTVICYACCEVWCTTKAGVYAEPSVARQAKDTSF